MATADQIKSMIRSFGDDEPERFFSIALQMAAHEAKLGHTALAHEIRELVDNERKRKKQRLKVVPFPQELSGLVTAQEPTTPLVTLIASPDIVQRLKRVIEEYFQRSKLHQYGLNHRRRLLLIGPPGTGKTMTSRVIAHELQLPLYTIQVDRLVTKFMGETSAKLRQIFDLMKQKPGVYFFDEFDAIGGERSLDNDVGEMRRVLNALLQFIEQDNSDSLILAATNNPGLLDKALFRRFDDVLTYMAPNQEERQTLIKTVLGDFMAKRFGWSKVLDKSDGLNYADLTSACHDAIKAAVLSDREAVTATTLLKSIEQRQGAYHYPT